MHVKDIMSSKVAFVSPETTVTQTAQLMQKHNIGSLPVCQNNNVVGIVTDRDIVVRNIAHGKDPGSTPVRDVMTSTVQTVSPDDDLQKAAQIMAQKKIRRIPVVNNNQLVGMLALGDLATQAVHDVELAQTLGEISEPAQPYRL